MQTPQQRDEQEKDARRELEGLQTQTDMIGTRNTPDLPARLVRHFAGRDDPADDNVVIWAKRIGRALSALLFVALLAYLYKQYAP